MKVYRIDRIGIKGNHFGLGREEKWCVKEDCEYPTLEEAESYVLKMNKSQHAVDLNITTMTNDEEIKQRCVYDEEWAHRRSYFLGQPPIKKIKELLSQDGVHLKENFWKKNSTIS